MKTIIPNATSSDTYPGCVRYAYRSLKKRETRTGSELVVSMFMSTIDNHPASAFTRKSNAAVTLAVDIPL